MNNIHKLGLKLSEQAIAKMSLHDAPKAIDIEDVIASIDLLHNEQFIDIVNAVGSIGRKGTGILIDQHLFLTAGHCIETVKENLFRAKGRPLYIDFNYQDPAFEEGTHDIIKYQILEPISIDTALDYGFLHIRPAFPEKTVKGIDRTWFKQRRTVVSHSYLHKQVIIVGHPAGGTKKGSIGPVVDQDSTYIEYKASTRQGSSGSPVVLLEDCSIIGLHCREREGISKVGLKSDLIKFPT